VGQPWKIRLPKHGGTPAREAPVAPWAGRLLRRWLDTHSALQISGTALFPASHNGRPWGKVSQYAAARSVQMATGIPDAEGGSFKLRHTFALRQLRRGAEPEQVAQWLGLSDVGALRRYRQVLMAPVAVV
jgi:site-specific recombinase XerD